MLRPTLTASALAALMLCTACDQNPSTQQAQTDEQQQAMRDTAPPAEPVPAPTIEPTAPVTDTPAGPSSGVGNEIAQATGTTVTFTDQELASAQKVRDVTNPGTTLANAAVKTKAGEAVGEVRSVVVGKDGKADQVVVEVGGFLNVGERAVALKANQFTYLPARNILITEVNKTDLEKMPAANTTPTP